MDEYIKDSITTPKNNQNKKDKFVVKFKTTITITMKKNNKISSS
jgi:hypothetical protein